MKEKDNINALSIDMLKIIKVIRVLEQSLLALTDRLHKLEIKVDKCTQKNQLESR